MAFSVSTEIRPSNIHRVGPAANCCQASLTVRQKLMLHAKTPTHEASSKNSQGEKKQTKNGDLPRAKRVIFEWVQKMTSLTRWLLWFKWLYNLLIFWGNLIDALCLRLSSFHHFFKMQGVWEVIRTTPKRLVRDCEASTSCSHDDFNSVEVPSQFEKCKPI